MGDVLDELGAVVGADHVLRDDAALARYLVDERRLYEGRARAVVRPADTAAVAAVVQACRRHAVPMVPQGGNTGYCGGATPDASGAAVVISLERLNRVRAVDARGFTMTAEAGVVLEQAQAAAAAQGRLFPLAMGSQGSCQIGGNLSTNAGGLAVLRYGTARELVLGLEVVLPDGRVLDALRALRKDNTGYDVKQLFLGAEGTLGIITAAVVKLFPATPERATAWAEVRDVDAACELLGTVRERTGDAVTTFEYLSGDSLALVREACPELRVPSPPASAHCVLVECTAVGEGGTALLERTLAEGLEAGAVRDAAVAASEAQRRAFWAVRERIPEAEKRLGGSVKHDVSVALGDVPAFVARAREAIGAGWPDARPSVYGHVGDGNVHFNVLAPPGTDGAAFRAGHADAVSDTLHDLAHAMGGSFSAEHGVGRLKRDLLGRYAGEVELDLMRTLKAALDPQGLMNPGKTVPGAG